MTDSLRDKASTLFKQVQSEFCSALELLEPSERFLTDSWDRKDPKVGFGGGGKTRVLRNGVVFEQAGVNFSEVHGVLTPDMTERLTGKKGEEPFFATGISLVIHPNSPMIPTTHANLRYLEVGGLTWFGGGTDLTPYYLFPEDASEYHTSIKRVCDAHSLEYYPMFKKWCDEYFYLPHRKETRGVGGIFFDYLGKENREILPATFKYVEDLGHALSSFYLPIVRRRKDTPWSEVEKNFQLIRRGRYVEFNLLYDRGTLFGLKTDGRIESILMSLPPNVKWEYNFIPQPGSREEALINQLKNPRDWV